MPVAYRDLDQGVHAGGIPGSRALARVNRSSLCRARVRLGEEVLETVFRQLAGPLAVPETPGAWRRGLRLLALDGTQFDVPDSAGDGDTFAGPSTGGTPFGFPQVRAAVLAEIGTHAILDAGLGGYRDGERRLAYPLASSTDPGDLVIADRGFWSVEFVHAFTTSGAHLLARLQSNHLGTTQAELPDSSRLPLMRPGRDARLRAVREGRVLPKETTYRVITLTKNDKVVRLGTSLLDTEQYPADELVALYRQRWEIELAFDEIKNHLGPGGPLRSRTPEAVRQELWVLLAVHQAVRRFAHDAAASGPVLECRPTLLPPLRPDRPAQRPVPARHLQAHVGQRLEEGHPGSAVPSAAAPARPGLAPSDQEADAVADPENPERPQQGRTGAMGTQPDHQAAQTPGRRQTRARAQPP
ncbi:IS4 family transposase [Streptomyces sp. NPDC018347]|uniref:IS4 family transposase n=1 Tax=Streptomyces sp. NPDC018347 TaxID=3157193 RepID=UPI003402A24C